jgi:ABC-2 type transport system ATP-binding protein
MEEHGLGYAIDRQIRQLSKGMAQQVQILGTLVHSPDLVIFDEPFSGLDALNQGKLEKMIRALAAGGTTVIFPPMSSPMPKDCATRWRSSRADACPLPGRSMWRGIASRHRFALKPATMTGRGAPPCPPMRVTRTGAFWFFSLPDSGIEPLLRA